MVGKLKSEVTCPYKAGMEGPGRRTGLKESGGDRASAKPHQLIAVLPRTTGGNGMRTHTPEKEVMRLSTI